MKPSCAANLCQWGAGKLKQEKVTLLAIDSPTRSAIGGLIRMAIGITANMPIGHFLID